MRIAHTDGCFFKQIMNAIFVGRSPHGKGGLCILQFLSPHSSERISESCSCTHLVSSYIVAVLSNGTCFMQLGGGGGGGVNKNVRSKTASLSHEVRLNHPYTTASL